MTYNLTDNRRKQYEQRWNALRINPDRKNEVTKIANQALANKARYQKISKLCGGNIPWEFIALTHYRESSFNFSRHLHEGSPLTARTRYVPAGRPIAPPANGVAYTFEESAIDALKMKRLHLVTDWSMANLSYLLEGYNGYGYAYRGLPSPYLYGGSDQYRKGKFVADHVFDPEHVDRQLGCLTILKRIRDLDETKSTITVATGGLATAGTVVASGFDIPWYTTLGCCVLVLLGGLVIYSYIKGRKASGKEESEEEVLKGTANKA